MVLAPVSTPGHEGASVVAGPVVDVVVGSVVGASVVADSVVGGTVSAVVKEVVASEDAGPVAAASSGPSSPLPLQAEARTTRASIDASEKEPWETERWKTERWKTEVNRWCKTTILPDFASHEASPPRYATP